MKRRERQLRYRISKDRKPGVDHRIAAKSGRPNRIEGKEIVIASDSDLIANLLGAVQGWASLLSQCLLHCGAQS